MNTTKAQNKAKGKPKKAYSSPRLIRYGHVRALTQAGPTGGKEITGKSGTNRRPSDRITKERIVRIGDHPLGIGLYLFDYRPGYRAIWGHGRRFGVMADEVETVMPNAVSTHPGGYRTVDYAMLGLSLAV